MKILFLFILVTLVGIISINNAFADSYWGNLKVDIEKSDRIEGESSDVIVVKAKMTNNDDEQITVYYYNVFLDDSKNRQFSTSTFYDLISEDHAITEKECPLEFSIDLNPGISEDGRFCFEVPKENLTFILHFYESSPDLCKNPYFGSCQEKTVRLVVNPPSPKNSMPVSQVPTSSTSSNIHGDMDELQKQISSLKSQITTKDNQISLKDREIASKNQEIKSLKDQISDKNEQINKKDQLLLEQIKVISELAKRLKEIILVPINGLFQFHI